MTAQDADVICVQETRAQFAQLDAEITAPGEYLSFFNDAEKKGYSGVGIYTRQKPDHLVSTLGWDWVDREGRFLQADFGMVSVISLYIPSGTSGAGRQEMKYDFMRRFTVLLHHIRKQKREYIICGDWNIAHKQIDLKNWRSNQKNSGFLPEERAWLDEVFDNIGMVDAFRLKNQEPEQYTWWSNRGRAWAKNVGWRLDYQVITPGLQDKVGKVDIFKQQRFSDHAPLIIEYDIPWP